MELLLLIGIAVAILFVSLPRTWIAWRESTAARVAFAFLWTFVGITLVGIQADRLQFPGEWGLWEWSVSILAAAMAIIWWYNVFRSLRLAEGHEEEIESR